MNRLKNELKFNLSNRFQISGKNKANRLSWLNNVMEFLFLILCSVLIGNKNINEQIHHNHSSKPNLPRRSHLRQLTSSSLSYRANKLCSDATHGLSAIYQSLTASRASAI
ncbi:hypothetical protein [Arsenophonus sp.]|uniref:hypothetical protein n=1 Tax=Arsenophonus sp. TaxID=1872640 RepID=UPI003879D2F3